MLWIKETVNKWTECVMLSLFKEEGANELDFLLLAKFVPRPFLRFKHGLGF